jgi:hypothetical protein
MKQCLFLFTLFVLSTMDGFAQQNEADKKAAQNAVVVFFDGLAETDTEKIRSACTDDVIILEHGLIWNFDSLAIRINSRKGKATDFKRINELDFLDTRVSGKVAWLYYRNKATITANGKTFVVKWLESAVLNKVNREWKIQLLHSTDVE